MKWDDHHPDLRLRLVAIVILGPRQVVSLALAIFQKSNEISENFNFCMVGSYGMCVVTRL